MSGDAERRRGRRMREGRKEGRVGGEEEEGERGRERRMEWKVCGMHVLLSGSSVGAVLFRQQG